MLHELSPSFASARNPKTTLGENHVLYANCLAGLAIVHRQMGDYPQAESLFRRALEIDKKNLGKSHPRCADLE